MKFRLVVYSLFVVVFFSSTGLSQNFTDTLELKNGDTIVSTIASVDTFLIRLSDERLISMKVVNSIKTQNEAFLSTLKLFYPEMIIVKEGDISTVLVKDIVVPVRLFRNNKFWQNMFAAIHYTGEGDNNLEIQFSIVPADLNQLLLQVSASSNLGPNSDDVNSVSQASIGAGYFVASDGSALALLLNYGQKFVWDKDFGRRTGQTLFVSLDIRGYIIVDKFFLSVGGRSYLRNVPIESESHLMSFKAGIGFVF